MSSATIQQNHEQFATIPPWPEQRAREMQTPTSPLPKPDTRRLLAVPTVSLDETLLYNACLLNDVAWWTCGILALLRTLVTMGYSTLDDARADGTVFKEVALARNGDTEKHIIKPFNLGLYFDAVRRLSQPVDHMPLQLGVANLQAACQGQVFNDAKLVLEHSVPHLESLSGSKGALAGHSGDVKRLRAEVTALVANLEKSKRATLALQEAAK